MTTTIEELPDLDSTVAAARSGRSPSRWRPVPIGIGALALMAGLAALGAGYEAVASIGDVAAYQRPGLMVDVGGQKLHLDCRGEGSPTVIMDAGLGGSSLDWSLVQPPLALSTRVCSYDRAGMGWSEPSSDEPTPSHLAAELHLLLQNAGVHGPYVLVGHSLAGKNLRMFAAAHPDDVAGLVLVDARSELVETRSDLEAFGAALEWQAGEYSWARRLGLARLFGAAMIDMPLLPHGLATQMALFETSPSAIAETTREGMGRTADDEALAAARLGSKPLVVIASGKNMADPNWAAAQIAMSKLSSIGVLLVAPGAGHAVHLEQPSTVIDAIEALVADLRASN